MDHQIRECWGLQRRWLRAAGVTGRITTNTMLTWHGYDHEKFFEDLDVVTGDIYPRTKGGIYKEGLFPGLSFLAAFLRGMKHGQNFGIAEMRCGPAEGLPEYPLPGEIRYWSHILLGAGADFVSFFRLDTCPSGRERNTCGMIPASGSIPRVYEEMQRLARETRSLLPLLRATTVPTAPVGIVYSYPTHVAMTIRPEFSEFEGPYGNGYSMHLARHFRAIVDGGIPADIVHAGDDFSKYRVLVISALAVVDEDLAMRLESYVNAGGIVLLWPWSGVMDENAKMHEMPLPAFLEKVAGHEGVVTEEFDPRDFSIGLGGGILGDHSFQSSGLVQTLKAMPGSRILADLTGHPSGESLPGLLEHQHGQGACCTVASFLAEQDLGAFYRLLLQKYDIEPEFRFPPGVHYSRRSGKDGELLFVFNSTEQTVTLDLAHAFQDVLSRCEKRAITLPARDVAILGWRGFQSSIPT